MTNSLVKSGTRKGLFGQEFYSKEELDLFITNYDTFTESSIEAGYGFDMKTLSLISSDNTYTTLLYNGEPITLSSELINELKQASFSPVQIKIIANDIEDEGAQITASCNSRTVMGIVKNGVCILESTEIGTYTISTSYLSKELIIPYYGKYEVQMD